MSLPLVSLGAESAASASPPSHAWHVQVVAYRAYADIAAQLSGLEGSSFQNRFWLETWLSVFAADEAIQPLLATFTDESGRVVMALPLIRRRHRGMAVIEFSDLAVTDYAAPLILRDQAHLLPAGRDLWLRLIDALPAADLLRFERLAPSAAGIANPFHSHRGARRSRVSGWALDMPERWEDCAKLASSSQRSKYGKFLRHLEQLPQSEMMTLREVPLALEALDALTRLQQVRLVEQGRAFHIDAPPYDTFYRRLVERGIPTGETLMCAIRNAGEWVAVNFAIRSGDELIYLRLGNLYGDWAKHGPGVAATEHLMREAHRTGVRRFDFGMGDYEYKRRFGARELELKDLVLPLSLKGMPYAAAWHGRRWATENPWLRRLLGKGEARRLQGASSP